MPTAGPGPSPAAAQATQAVNAVTDKLFGTRAYTPGAQFQLPRKVPLRIEPKTYFGTPTARQSLPVSFPSRVGLVGDSSRSLWRRACFAFAEEGPEGRRVAVGAANERTFLAWMSMAVTLGGVSTALVGFSVDEEPTSGAPWPLL